ncbi:MAG: hypothetical protein ACYC33_13155 [Thermoleophilia bacterium]
MDVKHIDHSPQGKFETTQAFVLPAVLVVLVFFGLWAAPTSAVDPEVLTLDSYMLNAGPLYETYVVNTRLAASEKGAVVERWSQPMSVLYIPDEDPAVVSAWVEDALVKVTKYMSPPETSRVISYVTVGKDGDRRVSSITFIGTAIEQREAIHRLTKVVNETGARLFEEAISESLSAVVDENPQNMAGLDAVHQAAPSLATDSYYRYVGSSGNFHQVFNTPGYNFPDGQIDIWFSTDIVWNDGSSVYDYWMAAMREEIRPGQFLIAGSNMGLYDIKTQYLSGPSRTIPYSSPASQNELNGAVYVSSLGWSPPGYRGWSYDAMQGDHSGAERLTLNPQYDVERLGNGSTYAYTAHHAMRNDWWNYNRQITLKPGFNQRVLQNANLQYDLVPGWGTGGSQVVWSSFLPLDDWAHKHNLAGYTFTMAKP